MNQKEKSEQSRAHILETAIRVFAEKKFEKTSVSLICREGKISKGQMYYYYDNKEDLYFDAFQYCYAKLADNLESFLPNSETTLEENLILFFSAWQHHWQKNSIHALFIGPARFLPPSEMSYKLMNLRNEFITGTIKPILRQIIQPYFDKDIARQEMLTDFTWMAVDYVATNVGLPKFIVDNTTSDFFPRQNLMFRQVIHHILYGCLN